MVFLSLVLSISGAAGLFGRGGGLRGGGRGSGGGSLTGLESFLRRFGKDFSCFILGLVIVYLCALFLVSLADCCIIKDRENSQWHEQGCKTVLLTRSQYLNC